jgi:hypothetical protein
MGEDAASVFFLGCFENRVTLYSQQVRALNLVDAILDQQLVREHGKVAIVGGRAAGITAAAALAKAAPELQKIDLFEARGLKRTSALLNRIGAFVIIEADQNLNRNAIVTKIGVPFDGDVPTTGPVRFAGEAPLTEMRSSPRTRRRDRGNFLRVTRFSRTSRTNPFLEKCEAGHTRSLPPRY